MSTPPARVRAAGVVPWRHQDGRLQVALVHRPRYDDWSWPKGKLDRGEDWAAAAAREAFEETGIRVRLGLPLPDARYAVDSSDERPVIKEVRYWAAVPVGGHGRLEHEVDAVDWLDPEQAQARLSYRRDRSQLDTLVAAHENGGLLTWPLLLVRHSLAEPRSGWDGPDPLRPLRPAGVRRAADLMDLLAAYAPTRLLSSPSVRCLATVDPYACARGLPVRTRVGLSEEGFERDPEHATRHLERLLVRAEPAALCTHGPVVPGLLRRLSSLTARSGDSRVLRRLAHTNLDKGEALALLLTGSGTGARVVHLERHRPVASQR